MENVSPLVTTTTWWEEKLVKTSRSGRFYPNRSFLQKNFNRKDGKSKMALLVDQIANGEADSKVRYAIATSAVQAVLNKWPHMPTAESINHDKLHDPLGCIPLLAYKNGERVEELVTVVQRLWTGLPENYSYYDHSFRRLLKCLGALTPMGVPFLGTLYSEHGVKEALIVILNKEKRLLASALFRKHLHYYDDLDPIHLYPLVSAGLPVADAKHWLDQSVNAKAGNEFKYKDALTKWRLQQ